MTLFDDTERKDLNEAPKDTSAFSVLNSYEWPDAALHRALLESWFERFPDEAKKDLRRRFRSNDDHTHESALFELFLHELLNQLGCEVVVHPEVPDSSGHPDFCVDYGTGSFYLEATTVGQQRGPFTRSANEEDVIRKLSQLTSPHFQIGVDLEGKLRRILSAKEVTRPFEELVADHHPDEVQRMIDEGGTYAAPCRRIEHGTWSLTGWLVPVPCDSRGKTDSLPLLIDRYKAKWVDSITLVRKALRDKSSKYGELDAPFMVAVGLRDVFAGGGNDEYRRRIDLEVLFGKETRYGRAKDGIWGDGRYTRLASVLMFRSIDLWNLPRASACVYLNPWSTDGGVVKPLSSLPWASLNNSEMQWQEGEDVAKLVGWT